MHRGQMPSLRGNEAKDVEWQIHGPPSPFPLQLDWEII
jgi:hypothetical protein